MNEDLEINIKRNIGSRKDVYLGHAIKTSGGMRKDDINKKEKYGKVMYVSKKVGNRMRTKIKINGPVKKAQTKKQPIHFDVAKNQVVEYVFHTPKKLDVKFENTIKQIGGDEDLEQYFD